MSCFVVVLLLCLPVILFWIILISFITRRDKILEHKRLQQRAVADEFINGMKHPTTVEINDLIDEFIALNNKTSYEAEEDRFRIERLREIRNRI